MSGFNLGGAVNDAADWACSAPLIRGVVGNPVFTALLITALAAVVAMALYHHQIKRGGPRRAVRALIYVFLLVTAVTFVHHNAVMHAARESSHLKGVRDVFSGIQQSRAVGAVGAVPVYPMGFEGQRAAVGGGPEAAGRAEGESPVGGGGGGGGGGGSRAAPENNGCGCPAARADNVAAGPEGAFEIEDVVLPAAASPFR